MKLTRRLLLQGAASSVLFPSLARGFGDSARFIPAVAQHGGRWDGRLKGIRRLCFELQRRTSVETVVDARALPLSSADLFMSPFLYFGGEGGFPAPSNAEVEVLRRYLTFGGFILADAQDASDRSGFDASFRQLMARVLPQAPLRDVPQEHVVFKTFYLLDAAPGRVLEHPQLSGAFLGKRAAVLYTQNDLIGALNRDEGGSWDFDCIPGGEPQREQAIRLAINLAMYALCVDYKDDAVHVESILRKRR